EKYVFDGKSLKVALLNRGFTLARVTFDLQLAAYLLNPADNNDEITAIGKRTGVRDVHLDEEVYGKGAKRAVPEMDILADHVARKANIVYTLKEQFMKDLEENEQLNLFKELELPLALILAEIEQLEL